MPLSNASRLADFGTGIGTAGAIIKVDNVNQRFGVGTTAPTATLGVAGIVSATAFYGDGSNLDGVASAGLGTALSETEFDPLTVIYQTSDTLSVGATITVDPPDATTKVAYTQYADIKLEGDADLIIADGDDFIPDILGLSTEGFSFSNANGNGIFDTVYTDNIERADGRGAPNFPLGITVSGISTLSGNVSIGGTLTYEDVTNVDSVGMVTARTGIEVLAGGVNIVGVVTASTGIDAASNLILKTGGNEKVRITSAGLVGIGTNIPASELHVMQSKSGGSSHASSQLTLERDGTNYLQFLTANNGTSGILFGDVADNDGTKIKYDHNTSMMLFETEAAERLRIGNAGQIGIAGANYGTSGQVITSQGGSAAPQWADASAGLFTTLHQGSYTFDSTSDTQLITGLGNVDILKITYMVNVTGNSISNPMPRITIGTSSGMKSDNYQSATKNGTSFNNSGNGQAAYWPYSNVQDFGNPGGDYGAGLFTCEMIAYNWQGTTYHVIGHWGGGYTSDQNQQLAYWTGSFAHRDKADYDRIQLQFQSASAQNTKNVKITIQGATYS